MLLRFEVGEYGGWDVHGTKWDGSKQASNSSILGCH